MSDLQEYTFSQNFDVNDQVKKSFDEYGYVIVRGLLDAKETKKLKTVLESDPAKEKYAFQRNDGEGKKATYFCWNHPGNDVTGMVTKSEKVAGTFEKLLGGELYHYHTKLIPKEAYSGGAHAWHQDYGYWYFNGCISPDMGTVFIALDEATKNNGCLKIIPKSHHLGRIEHIPVGDEVGADVERVEHILNVMPLLQVEMKPGDALFFHCNVLHRSDQNNSPNRRWAFLIAYNRASNNPVKKHHHPQYTPMTKVPNSAILESTDTADETGKDFFLGESKEHDLLEKKLQQ